MLPFQFKEALHYREYMTIFYKKKLEKTNDLLFVQNFFIMALKKLFYFSGTALQKLYK